VRVNRLLFALIAVIILGCLACSLIVLTQPAPLTPNLQSAFATSTALAGQR
jgi:hypothetical protein